MKKALFSFLVAAIFLATLPLLAQTNLNNTKRDSQFINAIAAISAYYLYWTGEHSKEATECSQIDNVHYCYYEGDPQTQTIIYALHGFANDQNFWSWNSVTKNIFEYWQENNIPQPHIISISFKNFWTYNSTYGNDLDTFSLKIEEQLNLKKMKLRQLYGDSMGGFNTLSWLSETQVPFNGVSVICPAIPFSLIPKKDASQYTQYKTFWGDQAEILFGKDSPSGKDFSFDKIVTKIKTSKGLKQFTLISVSPDFFGFYEGNEYLAQEVSPLFIKDSFYFETQKNIKHCDIDSKKLAQRLAGTH